MFTKSVTPCKAKVPAKKGYSFVRFYKCPYDFQYTLDHNWAWLSHMADRKMQIAEVDCSQYSDICSKFNITENPQILLFKDGIPFREFRRLDYGWSVLAFKRFLMEYVDIRHKTLIKTNPIQL